MFELISKKTSPKKFKMKLEVTVRTWNLNKKC